MRNRLLTTFAAAAFAFGLPWLFEWRQIEGGIALAVIVLASSAIAFYLICSNIILYRIKGLWSLLALPFALYWPAWLLAWG